MKKYLTLFFVFSAMAHAMDERLPVEKGKFEADLGYGFVKYTRAFGGNGNSENITGMPLVGRSIAQAKYGIAQGLDLELLGAAQFPQTQNAEDFEAGVSNPQIGVKYVHPGLGLGAYANTTLPFVAADKWALSPANSHGGGLLYHYRSTHFRWASAAGYAFTYNTPGGSAESAVEALVKPEFLPARTFGIYVGSTFALLGGSMGWGVDPGVKIGPFKGVMAEINVPVGLWGRDVYAGWGMGFELSVILPP